MSFEQYSREDIHIDNNVTEYRSLKETIDSFQTATEDRKTFLEDSIDKHYITTRIDQKRTKNPYQKINMTAANGTSLRNNTPESKWQAARCFVANLEKQDTDYIDRTVRGYDGLELDSYMRFDIKHYKDALVKQKTENVGDIQ